MRARCTNMCTRKHARTLHKYVQTQNTRARCTNKCTRQNMQISGHDAHTNICLACNKYSWQQSIQVRPFLDKSWNDSKNMCISVRIIQRKTLLRLYILTWIIHSESYNSDKVLYFAIVEQYLWMTGITSTHTGTLSTNSSHHITTGNTTAIHDIRMYWNTLAPAHGNRDFYAGRERSNCACIDRSNSTCTQAAKQRTTGCTVDHESFWEGVGIKFVECK